MAKKLCQKVLLRFLGKSQNEQNLYQKQIEISVTSPSITRTVLDKVMNLVLNFSLYFSNQKRNCYNYTIVILSVTILKLC